MAPVRTPKGDRFLVSYAMKSPTEMLEDPHVQDIVKRYRARLPPDVDKTDEQIVDMYARFLASKPREARS